MPWKVAGQGDTRDASRAIAFNPVLKIVLIAAVALGLLIPLTLFENLVGERAERQRLVEFEIGDLWGQPQTVAGPILLVPAQRELTDEQGRVTMLEEHLLLLPDSYKVEAVLEPERRNRGPFEAVVYRLALKLDAVFLLAGSPRESLEGAKPDWARARLLLGLGDQRSLTEAPYISWDGRGLVTEPGLPSLLADLTTGGLQSDLPLGADDFGRPLAFSASLLLNGSSRLSILPLGRTTSATVASSWPHPSFEGAVLPIESEVSDEGFSARWSASHFSRSYPQVWRIGGVEEIRLSELAASAFGVCLHQPVDTYRQSERTTKYGLLFILLTFAFLFLYEVISGRRLHSLQYGLVGCALALFYLLLLALAEQMPFALAYAIAAASIVGQLVFYTAGAFGSLKHALGLGLVVTVLYGCLYLLISLQDLALLVGAIALFAVLLAVMAATRRTDWYAVMPMMEIEANVEKEKADPN